MRSSSYLDSQVVSLADGLKTGDDFPVHTRVNEERGEARVARPRRSARSKSPPLMQESEGLSPSKLGFQHRRVKGVLGGFPRPSLKLMIEILPVGHTDSQGRVPGVKGQAKQ